MLRNATSRALVCLKIGAETLQVAMAASRSASRTRAPDK